MFENFLLTAATTIHWIMPSRASTEQEWITCTLNITDLKSFGRKAQVSLTVPITCSWLPRHHSAGDFPSVVEQPAGPCICSPSVASIWLNHFQQKQQNVLFIYFCMQYTDNKGSDPLFPLSLFHMTFLCQIQRFIGKRELFPYGNI